MTLKRYIVFTAIFMFIVGNGWAVSRVNSIEKLRPKGLKKTYIFFFKEEQAGLLQSKSNGKTRFEGVPCYQFTERYTLDLTPYDIQYSIEINNKHFVDEKGRYIGDDMTLTVGGQIQKLHLINTNDSLTGFFARDGERQSINQPALKNFFAIDNNMVDQIEFFLAFHSVNVGDTIYDSIFVPQAQIKAPVKIAVEGFEWVRYGKLYDSAYVCHFLEPTDQLVYYTKDRKVIRIDQETQDLQIILFESPLDRTAPKVQSFSVVDFFIRIPIYLVYLIFGAVFVLPFIKGYYKKYDIYVMLILGGALFIVLKQILFPLQKWYGEEYLIPGVEDGGSLYYYAVFTALISGFFQESAKLIPILLFYFWKKPKQQFSIVLGIFCGVGLGIIMACSLTGAPFQTGALRIASLGVFDQIIAILFHAIAGAAFGYGVNRGIKHLFIIWPVVVIIHSFSDYLMVFQQKGVFDMAVMELVKALVCLIFLLAVYVMIKKARRQLPAKI